MGKEMICIMCPRGCHLNVTKDLVVEGNFCPRGRAYGIEEMTHPTRILTTTIKTKSIKHPRISIKSKEGIPKGLLFEAMDKINHMTVENEVKIGEIVISNICNTGVDMIATKNI
jgi:CxxC motif-containing protein